MKDKLSRFSEIWFVDFEFRFNGDGAVMPHPVCLVAREIRSNKLHRVWLDSQKPLSKLPYSIDKDALVIAYYSTAEMLCHLALGFELPINILDLYVEFRCLTSGLTTLYGHSLLGCLSYFGLNGIAASEKESMRQLILNNSTWSEKEKEAILDYCQSDVDALYKLLPAMLPSIDLERALLRGRAMRAFARIEQTATPIDIETFQKLNAHWPTIQQMLIDEINKNYGVFENRSFRTEKFALWLEQQNIPWPRLLTGQLDLKRETFKQMSKTYPVLKPLYDLRTTLAELRLNSLAVSQDGRNRVTLSPFASKTGRCQPSNSRYIFGLASWIRGLIKPAEGQAIAYIDYSQQELAIAAKLSEDKAMMQAYQSGDFYLEFAKQAKAVPLDATKESHKTIRDQFKICALGVLFGMGEYSLSKSLNVPLYRAKELLDLHKKTYPNYWDWSDRNIISFQQNGKIQASFGWLLHMGKDINFRSVRNFPMQANGAEMLRIAIILATERHIKVCATVHDAIVVEASVEKINEVVAETQNLMCEASKLVLDGFPLRTEAKIVNYPNRYIDDKGLSMWNEIQNILEKIAS